MKVLIINYHLTKVCFIIVKPALRECDRVLFNLEHSEDILFGFRETERERERTKKELYGRKNTINNHITLLYMVLFYFIQSTLKKSERNLFNVM